MALTVEELNKYTELVIEMKRLEELEKNYNLESNKLYQTIREEYKYDEMQNGINTLADERSIGLKEIQDKIELIRQELIK